MTDTIRTLDIIINGLPTHAEYTKESIDNIFIPLLQKLTEIQKRENRRIVAFLAAPPGLGKSTLATFLEILSKEHDDICNVQAAGMDGFHHYAKYLKSHKTTRDQKEILLDEIKGAPETFDVVRLGTYIDRLLSEEEITWPTYDRTKHDVIDDGYVLKEKIIILEGNYLLLSDSNWLPIRKYASYAIYAYTDIDVLKPRLVARKIASGYTEEEAEAFYEFSDGRNAECVLNDVPEADMYLEYKNSEWYMKKND